MSNEYRVIVADEVARILVSHVSFLAQVSIEAADRLIESFENAANSLKMMPQRCPWIDTEFIPKNAYRYLVFEKRYLIVFQIRDDIVFVDYVVDCRQDYQWLIR